MEDGSLLLKLGTGNRTVSVPSGSNLIEHHGMRSSSMSVPNVSPTITAAASKPVTHMIALHAIWRLLVAIALGVWLARRRISSAATAGAKNKKLLLNQSTLQSLSQLIYIVFQPSLVFCSVSKTLFHSQSKSMDGHDDQAGGGLPTSMLLLMPVVAILHIGWGYMLAHMLLKVFQLKSPHDQRDVLVCSTFGNAAPLPLVLTTSLFVSSSSKSSQMHDDITSAISFYLLAWSPCFYTLCPRLLKVRRETTVPSLSISDEASRSDLFSASKLKAKQDDAIRVVASTSTVSTSSCTPPILGSAFGVLVGTIPPLANAFLMPDGALHPLYEAIRTLSLAYLPCVILVLAGSLVHDDDNNNTHDEARKAISSTSTSQLQAGIILTTTSKSTIPCPVSTTSPSSSLSLHEDESKPKRGVLLPRVSYQVILCIGLVRFIMLPILTAAVVQLSVLDPSTSTTSQEADATALLHRQRPIMVGKFVALLESGMPPAQNTVVLLQLQGQPNQAKRLAKLLTILYIVSLVPMTVLLQHILTSCELLLPMTSLNGVAPKP